MMLVLAAPLLLGAAPAGRLDVGLAQLRNADGHVHLCLSRVPARFKRCSDDPLARKLSTPAGDAGALRFEGLPSGDYALAVIHDENSNRRLDTFAAIPREGFGFSQNPAIRFGPPSFSEARFAIGAGAVRQNVRMKYLL